MRVPDGALCVPDEPVTDSNESVWGSAAWMSGARGSMSRSAAQPSGADGRVRRADEKVLDADATMVGSAEWVSGADA
jgi:hypothetical protein